MKLPAATTQLIAQLDELCHSVEDILLSGMTAASQATGDRLQVAFQEASKMRLLRLGSTLKVAVEEIHRFNHQDPLFSAKRLNFFLNRAWIISHGLKQAIQRQDAAHWQALTWNPAGQPLDALKVVTLGVNKRVVKGAFCAFEYRLRSIGNQPHLAHGTGLIWSVVFPLHKQAEVEAEAFLFLSQKQKFRPIDLLGEHSVLLTQVLRVGDAPPYRITLTDNSTVQQQEIFTAWQDFAYWDRKNAYRRLLEHVPSPFELDVELQEEVFLHDWQLGQPEYRPAEQVYYYPLTADHLLLQMPVAEEDVITQHALQHAGQLAHKPPLFGLLHYESCQLRLQPLSLLELPKPKQLALSANHKSAADLLRSMKS